MTSRFSSESKLLLRVYIVVIVAATLASASTTYTVLHAFRGKPDGGGLVARLALDAQGDLYGTTTGGGVYGLGTVFRLTPADNRWKETIIHNFCPDYPTCSDGDLPREGVTVDKVGSVFGTTGYTTFELSPSPSGWDFQVILNTGTSELALGEGGGLFAESGPGVCKGGDILKLKPDGGNWVVKDIYDFCLHNNQFTKGNSPNYGLSWDNAGNLYGVTDDGGRNGYGVVFQLEHTPQGWKEHVLHSFRLDGQDAFFPQAGVVVDAAGVVYGSTMQGGSERCGGPGCGTIYKLTQQPDGHWKETILFRFPDWVKSGYPLGTLAMDSAGNLYGVAGGGGNACSCGVVYKFVHNPDDTWTYKVLHRFKGTDGALPVAGVILDAKGNIYGTTSTGGKGGYGVVFKITQ